MKTISQKAKELGISRQAVWYKIKEGKIKARKVGSVFIIENNKKKS